MTKIVSIYKCQDDTFKVDLSISFQVITNGYFTPEQDATFKIRHLRGFTQEQAESIVGLVNSCYDMGYVQAQRDLANRLGFRFK